MKEITITANDAGQRLDKFLIKTFNKLPTSMIYKGVRTKRIKVDGKRCTAGDKLRVGNTIQLYINDEFLDTEKGELDFLHAKNTLSVIYEDEHIILMDKPVGLSVHADNSGRLDTLINRLKRYLYESGSYDPALEQSFSPALCNRIDRNTCGIVIGAKTAAALRIINEKIKNREITKKYLFISHGEFENKSGVLSHYLTKDGDTNMVKVVLDKTEDSKTSVTEYRVLESKPGFSLVEATLVTGRTHQIRAQFAYVGHPLLGDGKYGKPLHRENLKIRHQVLASYSVTFDFTEDAQELSYLEGKTFKLDSVWFDKIWDEISEKLRMNN